MKRALFCWEHGDGSGHVIPYLSLIGALQSRGWQVSVVARNTAEVGARVQASGAALLQAPVCLAIFPEMDSAAFSTTELLLQAGYGYEPMLDGLFSSWLGLMRLSEPDLVIGSAAPTAHLAAQCLLIPDVAIGTGFDCRVAASPAPLMRPWQQGIEQRIAVGEDRVRQTINAVMLRHKFARRQYAMDMYANVPTLLCTLAELDHFGQYRNADAEYLGTLTAASSSCAVNEGAQTINVDIFVYLHYTPIIDGLLRALAKLPLSTLVYMPNLSPAERQKLEVEYAETLTFAAHAINVGQILPTAKLIVSNAGHALTMEALLAGKPLLLLPTHWEQSTTAAMAVKLGAAISVAANEQHPKFHRRIDQLLQSPAYREAAEQFSRRYRHSPKDALRRAVQVCERRALSQAEPIKLLSVG